MLKSISHRDLLVCDRSVRVCVFVYVRVKYDVVCQKSTSARLMGCVKILLSQISDDFIAKSSDRTFIQVCTFIWRKRRIKKTLAPKA